MSETKHTPGSTLTVETVNTSIGVCHKIGPLPGNTYACIYDDCRVPSWAKPELLAMAHLFSAAPELLEVLKTIENDDNKVPDWLWERIQRVIAEAEGRNG